MNFNEIEFGDSKKEYGVIEHKDGSITVNVYHRNKKIRSDIQNNRENPSYFLKFENNTSPNPRAQFHLSKIVRNYRAKFRNNIVKFMMK